eukprot:TRINITY_DN14605_c0_g2_i2.p2 TRINITY_DN14605_c0_g2~~TRINITY_DN14605_c0_g2_i2.p2  ORF type:complete len:133 (-),score=18.86 TRINITY_DN14605_c0_g2_i2:184-582(-)
MSAGEHRQALDLLVPIMQAPLAGSLMAELSCAAPGADETRIGKTLMFNSSAIGTCGNAGGFGAMRATGYLRLNNNLAEPAGKVAGECAHSGQGSCGFLPEWQPAGEPAGELWCAHGVICVTTAGELWCRHSG